LILSDIKERVNKTRYSLGYVLAGLLVTLGFVILIVGPKLIPLDHSGFSIVVTYFYYLMSFGSLIGGAAGLVLTIFEKREDRVR
jgi:hypothetical protein